MTIIDDKKIEEATTVASISDTEKGRVREGNASFTFFNNGINTHELQHFIFFGLKTDGKTTNRT